MLTKIKPVLLALIIMMIEGAIMHFNLFFKTFTFVLLTPLYFAPEQIARLTTLPMTDMIMQPSVTAWIATAFQISLLLVVSLTTLLMLLHAKRNHAWACEAALQTMKQKEHALTSQGGVANETA